MLGYHCLCVRDTNLVFWTLDDLVVHPYGVGEGVCIEILELEVLCEMECGEGMDWAAP